MAKKSKPAGRKLKVFRTPIGFHDAYVAAASQKAALEAWGADSNLFAQGIAEQVDDEKLMEEPLSRPGEVIRRLRGSADEHVAELAKSGGKNRPSPRPTPASGRGGTDKAKPKAPKPSRDELEAAEAALEKAEKKHRKKLREIEDRMAAIERERRALQRKHESERDSLAETRDRARSAYQRAMRAWEKV